MGFLALVSASAFVAPGHVASVSVRGSAVTMGAKKGGVNPALFSNGIDPKKIAALKKKDDAAGLPKWNLFRVLPKQTKDNTRPIDGSLRFPKPWGKGTWDK